MGSQIREMTDELAARARDGIEAGMDECKFVTPGGF